MNIFKDGVLVDVNVSFWSGAKILTPKDLGLKDEDVVDAYKLGRKMLIPETAIRKFRAVEQRARYLVDKGSFRFPIGNARFIPKKKFARILDELKKCQEEYTVLTEELVKNYEVYRSEMMPVYKQAAEIAFMRELPSTHEFSIENMEASKDTFIAEFLGRINAFYPDVQSLRARFSLDWDVYEIALPRMRRTDSAIVVDEEDKKNIATEEYKEQVHGKISRFIDEVVEALRNEAAEICGRVIKNIKEGKVIRERTLQSLRDFIDQFSELNFVGDQKIETQLDELKKQFLDVHTSEQICSNEELKNELGRRLGELSTVASDITDINSVTGEYRRQIDW